MSSRREWRTSSPWKRSRLSAMGFAVRTAVIATKEKNLAADAGALAGQTVDKKGSASFVLTLATREHSIIRREKATSISAPISAVRAYGQHLMTVTARSGAGTG